MKQPPYEYDDPTLFTYERKNQLMQYIYSHDTYVIKKKANYLERISCSLLTFDNVYKLYNWNENTISKGIRVARFEQVSSGCIRACCCSHFRSYRTLGEISNKTKILTKSIRTFRWMCPCNKRKPITAVFDAQSGYLGKVELMSSCERLCCCQ
jgi:hypothetical protein